MASDGRALDQTSSVGIYIATARLEHCWIPMYMYHRLGRNPKDSMMIETEGLHLLECTSSSRICQCIPTASGCHHSTQPMEGCLQHCRVKDDDAVQEPKGMLSVVGTDPRRSLCSEEPPQGTIG